MGVVRDTMQPAHISLWLRPDTASKAMVAGVEDLIAAERERLKGDPEREIRGLRRQLSDLEARRQRLQDAYLGGAFTLGELRARQQQEEEITYCAR